MAPPLPLLHTVSVRRSLLEVVGRLCVEERGGGGGAEAGAEEEAEGGRCSHIPVFHGGGGGARVRLVCKFRFPQLNSILARDVSFLPISRALHNIRGLWSCPSIQCRPGGGGDGEKADTYFPLKLNI